jgi:hypothetical protein
MKAVIIVGSKSPDFSHHHGAITIGELGEMVLTHTFDRVPTACWAFGDDISVLPMLETVGHPVAVVGDAALGEAAGNRGWRCMCITSSEDPAAIPAHAGALVREAT